MSSVPELKELSLEKHNHENMCEDCCLITRNYAHPEWSISRDITKWRNGEVLLTPTILAF